MTIKNSPEPCRMPDAQQERAIRHTFGPCRVLAGPGSGKTYVLVEHILYLITVLRIPPQQIVVLTFSRAAAQEMRSRFFLRCREMQIGDGFPGLVTFGTLHALFYRILQRSSRQRLTLISAQQKHQLLTQILQDEGVDADARTLQEIEQQICRDKMSFTDSARLRAYEEYLSENHLIDFTDMVLRCRELLSEDPEALSYWRGRFSHYLVDEFQDCSEIQYRILVLLAGRGQNLFVVGDDDQSIYGFRGASPSVMRAFCEDHSGCAELLLARNYRCDPFIVRAAGKVISENRNRIPKEIIPWRVSEDLPRDAARSVLIRGFRTEAEEYAYLARRILRERSSIASGGDGKERSLAVIVRTNLQAQVAASALSSYGLVCAGFRRGNGVRRELLLDALSYYRTALKLSSGMAMRSDFYRIMNRPERFLYRSDISSELLNRQSLLKAVSGKPARLKSMEKLLQDLTVLSALSPSFSFRYLRSSVHYEDFLLKQHKKETESVPRELDLLQEKLLGCKSCLEAAELLEKLLASEEADSDSVHSVEIREGTKQTADREKELQQDLPPVRVITMHASKGLEFDSVYLPDLNEGILPGRRCEEDAEAVEEERRLFYVAMTRARNRLELLYVSGTENAERMPSRFLAPLGIHNDLSERRAV